MMPGRVDEPQARARWLRLPARRSLWEVGLAALGLNLWLTFLLLPALHLRRPVPPATIYALIALPLLALAVGLLLRRRLLLLLVFPLLCLVPPVAFPRLVGINVYSPLTFALVGASLLAYLVAAPLTLTSLSGPPQNGEQRALGARRLDGTWRRRVRIHRGLAAVAGLFPAVLLATVFLHDGLRRDLALYYPQRASAAQILLGTLALLLWLGIFYVYFHLPLQAHVRGDSALKRWLQRARGSSRRRPSRLFYVFIGAALALMVLLALDRWAQG